MTLPLFSSESVSVSPVDISGNRPTEPGPIPENGKTVRRPERSGKNTWRAGAGDLGPEPYASGLCKPPSGADVDHPKNGRLVTAE